MAIVTDRLTELVAQIATPPASDAVVDLCHAGGPASRRVRIGRTGRMQCDSTAVGCGSWRSSSVCRSSPPHAATTTTTRGRATTRPRRRGGGRRRARWHRQLGDAAPELRRAKADGDADRSAPCCPRPATSRSSGRPRIAGRAAGHRRDQRRRRRARPADVAYLPGDSGDADPTSPTRRSTATSRPASTRSSAPPRRASRSTSSTRSPAPCMIQFSPANTSPRVHRLRRRRPVLPHGAVRHPAGPGARRPDRRGRQSPRSRSSPARTPTARACSSTRRSRSRSRAARSWSSQVYDPEAQTFDAEVDAVVVRGPRRPGADRLRRVEPHPDLAVRAGLHARRQEDLPGRRQHRQRLGEDFAEPGALDGVKGTLPVAELHRGLPARLLGDRPGLIDFSYGPETYDAVIITALAAAGREHRRPRARSPRRSTASPARARSARPSTTATRSSRTATTSTTTARPGPQDFSQPGEPTAASFAVLTYGDDNQIDAEPTEFRSRRALISSATRPAHGTG